MKKIQKCTVGRRIFRNYNFLKLLVLANKQKRLNILKNASPDQLYSIIETAANLVKYKKFCLNRTDKKRIKPYEKLMLKLADMNSPSQVVLRFQQSGKGFWMALLIPVLAEITRTILSHV